MKRFNRYILLGGVQILILSSIGCTENEFTSHWRDREITVDGDQEDWQGQLAVPKDKNVALGFMNDESNLYVTLSSSDRRFVYELKIPLGSSPDSPYAVNISPGKSVGIGFETGEIDLTAMRSQRAGSGMRGGGMRGGGRRPGGMPGVGQGRQMPEPFRYWIRVTLDSGK